MRWIVDKNIKVNLGDQAVKGAILGALAYFADAFGLDATQVAVAMPIALTALAWVSTKIGDKGTTALFKVIVQASAAQAKKGK
jgi:hypothetical protein